MEMKCKSCQAEWKIPNGNGVEICPFCQSNLKEQEPQFDTSTQEGAMLWIVQNYNVTIYLEEKRLIGITKDMLANQPILNLLVIIIEKGASRLVYKVKDKPVSEMYIEYQKVLDVIHSTTLIAKDVINPALILLFVGIGIDVSNFPQTQVKTQEQTQEQPKTLPTTIDEVKELLTNNNLTKQNQENDYAQTILENVLNNNSNLDSNLDDFKIENGVLIKYSGKEKSVSIPNNVHKIDFKAFFNCKTIEEVIIPNSVIRIEQSAFDSCASLYKVSIPDSVVKIGFGAFAECYNLTNIEIPESVAKIGWFSFQNCKNLQTVVFKNPRTKIGVGAFDGCDKYIR